MSDVIDVESVDEERSLSRLQEFGFMLVPVVIGIGATLLVGPVAQFYQPDIWAIANASILFSLSSALFVLWYKAPTDERMLFVRIGQGLFPPTPGLTSPLVVIALLGFLFLMLASFHPVLFAVLLLAMKMLESINTTVATPFIRRRIGQIWAADDLPAAQRRRSRTLPEWKLEADAVDTFYFKRPWQALATAECVVVGCAATIGAYALNVPDSTERHLGMVAATLLIATGIIGNEVFNAIWRFRRDRVIDALAPDPLPLKVMEPYERQNVLAATARANPGPSAATRPTGTPPAKPKSQVPAKPGPSAMPVRKGRTS
jgi:hypothetical protein